MLLHEQEFLINLAKSNLKSIKIVIHYWSISMLRLDEQDQIKTVTALCRFSGIFPRFPVSKLNNRYSLFGNKCFGGN